MNLKYILIILIANNIAAMDFERPKPSLKDMLIEPAPLLFQAAWHAIANNKPLDLFGAENLSDVINKIKAIQECHFLTYLERKLLITLIYNPNFDKDKIEKYFLPVIKKYLKKESLDTKIELLNAMLTKALRKNNPLAVLLIYLGADVNVKTKKGINTLMLAADRANTQLTQMLIDSGADISKQIPLDYHLFILGNMLRCTRRGTIINCCRN